MGADAICEKPLVINPWNLDQLSELEQTYGKKIYNVLQLRLHDSVAQLKSRFQNISPSGDKTEVCLTYITRRGKWYHYSWKGDPSRSGALPLNIGVHFFDFLSWVFGNMETSQLHLSQPSRWSGVLELERARVKWFLSVDADDLPENVAAGGGYAYRNITCDGENLDLSTGFTDLHTKVYEDVLGGGGFGIEDARHAIEIVSAIRNAKVDSPGKNAHPFLLGRQPLANAG